MRIPLVPTAAYLTAQSTAFDASAPPLAFIDNEPYLIELQGSLEVAGGAGEGSMAGVSVGRMDLSDPKKPVLVIAHARLEGKIVTLPQPYALLRSTPHPSTRGTDDLDDEDRPTKRTRHSPTLDAASGIETTPSVPSNSIRLTTNVESSPEKPRRTQVQVKPPTIEIIGIVRKKIQFSRRPEPISHIVLTSDAAEPGDDA